MDPLLRAIIISNSRVRGAVVRIQTLSHTAILLRFPNPVHTLKMQPRGGARGRGPLGVSDGKLDRSGHVFCPSPALCWSGISDAF